MTDDKKLKAELEAELFWNVRLHFKEAQSDKTAQIAADLLPWLNRRLELAEIEAKLNENKNWREECLHPIPRYLDCDEIEVRIFELECKLKKLKVLREMD